MGGEDRGWDGWGGRVNHGKERGAEETLLKVSERELKGEDGTKRRG